MKELNLEISINFLIKLKNYCGDNYIDKLY